MFGNWYNGKRVFITGHTGFKGAWLSLWLKQLGASVYGFALKPPTKPNLHEIIESHSFVDQFEGDIRDNDKLTKAIRKARPDLIFHLAAQPIVRLSYNEPLETFEINALGTAKLLETVRRLEIPCDVVVITSDKCYENREWEYGYRETDPLGGHDVYSMSKAAAELVAHSWGRSFFVPNPKLGKVVTARAGNVIGGGDYAADRIVPDCVRALTKKQPIVVRNPKAVRPWQHVLECCSGYLWLGARLATARKDSPLVSSFNFGPEANARKSVGELVESILKIWPGTWEDHSDPKAVHEAKLLTLSIEKAAALLNWRPCSSFEETIQMTMDWYRKRHAEKNTDMLKLSIQQIESYVAMGREQTIPWAH